MIADALRADPRTPQRAALDTAVKALVTIGNNQSLPEDVRTYAAAAVMAVRKILPEMGT